jgi:hypothetical protein
MVRQKLFVHKIMRKYIPPLILLVISLIIILIWFHNGLLIAGGEEGVIFYNPLRMIQLSGSVWVDILTGFAAMDYISRIPLFYFVYGLSLVHFSPGIIQAIVFYILMSSSGVSIYYLVLHFLKNNSSKIVIALVSAIFYLLNPYTMTQVWNRGIYDGFFIYAALPLLLYIFIVGCNERKLLFTIVFSLVSVLFSAAFGVPTNIIVLWSVISLYVLYNILTVRTKNNIIYSLYYFFLSLFFWSMVNAWWLLPLLTSANSAYSSKLSPSQDNISTLIGESTYFTFPTLIRLMQDFYFYIGGAYGTIYESSFFQVISFISPLILLWAIIRIRKIRQLWFFFLPLIIGFIVSSGTNPPFGREFLYVFKRISFLQAFRNPYEKYGVVFLLGYAPLFAFGLVDLSYKIGSFLYNYIFKTKKKKNKQAKKNKMDSFYSSQLFSLSLIGVVFILISGIFLWPLWTGKVVTVTGDKIGIAVPQYYTDLRSWLRIHNDENNYRVFMTPLASEGLFQDWNGRIYDGVDSSSYILDGPVVSYTPQIPFVQDLLLNMEKYMERTNMVPMLSILRTKYLVDRKDVLDVKPQIENFTTAIYPSSENVIPSLCLNKSAAVYPSEILCYITKDNKNFARYRYVHVFVKTDKPAAIEIAISDNKAVRNRWDGVQDTDYQIPGGEWKDLVLPLDAATEYHENENYGSVASVEVIAHPLPTGPQVTSVAIRGIAGDAGTKQNLDEFSFVKRFGKLDVYTPKHFNPVPDLGLISSVVKVNSFFELFNKAEEERNFLPRRVFLVASQNEDISKQSFPVTKSPLHNIVEKISLTRYLISTNSNSPDYLLLSDTFNSQWKVIPDVSSNDLNDNFFTNVALISRQFVPEDNHFVANGYANLWRISGSRNYAVIFLPQIYADMGREISVVGISLMSIGLITILYFKNRKKKSITT